MEGFMEAKEFKKEIYLIITSAIERGEDAMLAVNEKFGEIASAYDSCSPELQKMFDDHVNLCAKIARENVGKMEDSIKKREAIRSIRKMENSGYNFDKLYSTLIEVKPKDQVLQNAEGIILGGMGLLIDLTSDITFDESNSKYVDFLKVALYQYIIEELTLSKYLIDHNYFSQTYTHLRSVYETVDLIDLFIKQPSYLDLWADDSQEEAIVSKKRTTFFPANVRKLIGKNGGLYEKIYWLLCEIGTHTTFKNINSRMEFISKDSGLKKATINFKLGGIPFREDAIFCNVLIIQTILYVLLDIEKNYSECLFEEEVNRKYDEIMKATKDFYSKSIANEFQKMGFDISEFTDILSK